MKKSYLQHFAVIGSGTFLSMLIGLITTPIITRLVNPIEYGQYSIFTMYSSIAVMVLCLGLDQALVRYYYANTSIIYKRSLLFQCIKLPVLISVIASIAIMAMSIYDKIPFEFNTLIMMLLCIYTILQIVYRFSQLIIRLEYKSKLFATLNIINKAVYIVIVIPLVMVMKEQQLLVMVVGIILATTLCIMISLYLQRDMWNPVFDSNEVKIADKKELIKYGAPYIISMGITTLFQATDQLALNQYCTYYEVGIYASTMTLIHVFALIQTTFNSLWAPMAVEHYTNKPEDSRFYQRGNQIITVVMYLLGITLLLVKDVFASLLGAKYRDAAYILPFLIFNPIMNTISETTVCGLVFKKKSNMQVLVAAGACTVNILGNTMLVPRLGCQGAAIATGISYIVFFSLRTFFSNKYYYVDFHLKRFFIITFIVALYALYNTFIPFNIGTLLGGIFCFIILFVFYKETIVWGVEYSINLFVNKNRIK